MARLHIVLDTNAFRGLSLDALDQLARYGLPIRVSDLAIAEPWANSVARYTDGMDRRQARGLFFARIRRVLPYLDATEPLALVGADWRELLHADISGTEPETYRTHQRRAFDFLRRAARPELTDEEWLDGAQDSLAPFLDGADAQWGDLNLPEDELWARYDAEYRAEHREQWDATPLAEKYRDTRAFVIESLGLDADASERADSTVRLLAWRVLNNTHAFGRARRNDGADNLLPQHVAMGGMLITSDLPFLGAIEASQTRHGPWIRHIDEALSQPPPSCMAWEADAETVVSNFRRTSVREEDIADARWVEQS